MNKLNLLILPWGKAFEKQIKTIEDQREKQVEVLENWKDYKKQLANDYEDKLLHSKEREIFQNIYNKRLDKIKGITGKIDDNNLVFTTISTRINTDFSKKMDLLTFLNKILKRWNNNRRSERITRGF